VLKLAMAAVALCVPACAPDHQDSRALPRCADVEGVVYVAFTDDDFGCDVVPPQVLVSTGTPEYECDREFIPTGTNAEGTVEGECWGMDY
jgi:hypothetical protein